MSTSSVIGSMQSALDCAGKCDCCDRLQQQINDIRLQIARLPKPGDNNIQALVAVAVGAALAQKLPGAVASEFNARGAGFVTTPTFEATKRQMESAISDVRGTANAASTVAGKADTKAASAEAFAGRTAQEANAAQAEIARVRRIAEAADIGAREAGGEAMRATSAAGTSTKIANNAFNEAENAAKKAALLEKQAAANFAKLNQIEDIARTASRESGLAKGLANQAKNVAEGAGTTAAKASKVALDSANEVSGLKGLVDGFKGKLGEFGNAIAKLEGAVGNAIVQAAKAVGISEVALGRIAGLAGKVLELFNIVSTIFILLEQLAVLNILGDRIDAVERGLDSLNTSISGILGRLLGLQNRIGAVAGQLPGISATADSALALGSTAASLARSAYSAAGVAESDAQRAQSTAVQAQVTADGAVRNASQANTNATTAYKKANEAQGIAEQAKQVGGKALEVGGTALSTALTAIALYQGLKLLRGLPGLPGRDGRNGINGLPGVQGLRGVPGSQGIPGIPGRNGITTVVQIPGVPGKQGERGIPGIPGLPGRQGLPGTPGRNGINGIPGKNGINGLNGVPGVNGTDGRNGIDVNPVDVAGLRALIVSQHTQTRANSNAQHGATRIRILTPIMTALAPILALLKRIYDAITVVSNAAILTLLNVINSKLGAQVTGGLSQFIKTIAENTYVEKALAVLTFAATVHNALMLSNNLAQTLGTIIDQVLGFVLPKGLDGNPISVGNVIGKAVHEIVSNAIGEANYTTISKEWALANRIYQATSNVFNSITNAVSAITAGLELIGGNVGKIGNALKIWGVLGEKAYGWMNPQPNLHGRFFTFMNGASEAANTIQSVVQVPIAIKDAVIEVNSAREALQKDLNQTDPKDSHGDPLRDALGNPLKYEPGTTIPDPTKTVLAEEQAKANSRNVPPLSLEDLFNAGD